MLGRIKIYSMRTSDLEDPTAFEMLCHELSAERQAKIERAKLWKDQKLSLAAGILLDQGLRAYGLREAEVRTGTGVHGKPYFPDYPGIHFSLSHSEEMAMAVFAETEIGCDIEFKKRSNDKLAKRFFCQEEYEWLTRPQSQTEQKDRFYRLWTLKESFLKATGFGLHLPLDSFCFHIEEEKARRTQIPLKKEYGGRTQISFEEGEEAEDQNHFLIRRSGTTANVIQQVNSFQYEFAEYQFGEYCAAICLCDNYGE